MKPEFTKITTQPNGKLVELKLVPLMVDATKPESKDPRRYEYTQEQRLAFVQMELFAALSESILSGKTLDISDDGALLCQIKENFVDAVLEIANGSGKKLGLQFEGYIYAP